MKNNLIDSLCFMHIKLHFNLSSLTLLEVSIFLSLHGYYLWACCTLLGLFPYTHTPLNIPTKRSWVIGWMSSLFEFSNFLKFFYYQRFCREASCFPYEQWLYPVETICVGYFNPHNDWVQEMFNHGSVWVPIESLSLSFGPITLLAITLHHTVQLTEWV